MALVILFVGVLVFLAHAFAALFERWRIPDVLTLVVLGVLIGPVAGLVKPEALGQLGPVFTTLALVVILFEAGVGLDFSMLREALGRTLRLTLANYLCSMMILGLAAAYWLDVPVLLGLTLGATVSGTSSAEVIPLVKTLRLQPLSKTTLLLESTLTDVLCIVFTLGFLHTVRFDEFRPGLLLGE
ncbi:MAG: cation:proton antiporter, partial [Acidobacteria bacterium]|nr:cation:proton antiporter [Acidobacteriota bacterium]